MSLRADPLSAHWYADLRTDVRSGGAERALKLTAVDANGVTHLEVGHEVAHVAFNAVDPLDPIVSFDKMSVTCS